MTYYHVSSKDLGKNVKFVPRIPQTTVGPKENSTIKRICLAPTIIGCMAACEGINKLDTFILYFIVNLFTKKLNSYPAVYKPLTRISVYKPNTKQVPDVKETGEVWYLKELDMVRVGYVDMRTLLLQHKVEITNSKKNRLSKTELEFFRSGMKATRKIVHKGQLQYE